MILVNDDTENIFLLRYLENMLRMNRVEREREKVSLLQSSSLLLLPNSVTMSDQPSPSPQAPHRTILSLTFAEAELRLLVTLSRPLDFTILTPALLPMASLGELEEHHSLVSLVQWLLTSLRHHQAVLLQSGLLEHIPGQLDHLAEVCPGLRQELVARGAGVVVLLRLPLHDQPASLHSLADLLSADTLLNTSEHYFILRLGFSEAGRFLTEDFSIQFSSSLATMLPELAALRLPGMADEVLQQFVMATKEQVERHLERATKDWSWRADLLLPILDHFREEDEALVSLDLDSMASLDVVFQTEKKTHLISILLATASSRDKHMFEFRSGYFVSLVFL